MFVREPSVLDVSLESYFVITFSCWEFYLKRPGSVQWAEVMSAECLARADAQEVDFIE